MTFIRVMGQLFGALLLLYAGGCALFGGFMAGDELLQNGWFSRSSYTPLVIIIGMPTIALSGFLGWRLIALNANEEADLSIRYAAIIAGSLLLADAAFVTLLMIDLWRPNVSLEANGEMMLLLGAFVLGLGLPGWLFLRWGFGRGPKDPS